MLRVMTQIATITKKKLSINVNSQFHRILTFLMGRVVNKQFDDDDDDDNCNLDVVVIRNYMGIAYVLMKILN